MKRCTVCHVVKPLSEYHRQTAASDGLAYRCKDCENRRRLQPARGPRRKLRLCDLCGGMPHRVPGKLCKCGLARGVETIPRETTTGVGQWHWAV